MFWYGKKNIHKTEERLQTKQKQWESWATWCWTTRALLHPGKHLWRNDLQHVLGWEMSLKKQFLAPSSDLIFPRYLWWLRKLFSSFLIPSKAFMSVRWVEAIHSELLFGRNVSCCFILLRSTGKLRSYSLQDGMLVNDDKSSWKLPLIRNLNSFDTLSITI